MIQAPCFHQPLRSSTQVRTRSWACQVNSSCRCPVFRVSALAPLFLRGPHCPSCPPLPLALFGLEVTGGSAEASGSGARACQSCAGLALPGSFISSVSVGRHQTPWLSKVGRTGMDKYTMNDTAKKTGIESTPRGGAANRPAIGWRRDGSNLLKKSSVSTETSYRVPRDESRMYRVATP